jgi:hypothetical protein
VVSLWKETVEAGFVASQARFAESLELRIGAERNLQQAIAYYRSAASQGSQRVQAPLHKLQDPGFETTFVSSFFVQTVESARGAETVTDSCIFITEFLRDSTEMYRRRFNRGSVPRHSGRDGPPGSFAASHVPDLRGSRLARLGSRTHQTPAE